MNQLSRLRKTKAPCPGCFLHLDRCICSHIPLLKLKTRLTLIIHYKELKRTTNTGRLAVKAMTNSEMLVRGQMDSPLVLGSYLQPEYRQLFLYPSEEVAELTPALLEQDPRPVQLIVPDGNWRQASKVKGRHAELAGVECVKITRLNEAATHLRREHFSDGMSTLEAIAHAFTILEGPVVGEQLLHTYQLKLVQTMLGRGTKI